MRGNQYSGIHNASTSMFYTLGETHFCAETIQTQPSLLDALSLLVHWMSSEKDSWVRVIRRRSTLARADHVARWALYGRGEHREVLQSRLHSLVDGAVLLGAVAVRCAQSLQLAQVAVEVLVTRLLGGAPAAPTSASAGNAHMLQQGDHVIAEALVILVQVVVSVWDQLILLRTSGIEYTQSKRIPAGSIFSFLTFTKNFTCFRKNMHVGRLVD